MKNKTKVYRDEKDIPENGIMLIGYKRSYQVAFGNTVYKKISYCDLKEKYIFY